MRIEHAVPIDYDVLIQADRVHSALYTDPVIFDEEMEKIFHNGWVFVGHDSEIPTAGDYVTRQIGYQPVIMSRGKDGRVHVVRNRCAHRGNKICARDSGNSKVFACPYHGWVFDLDGSLLDTPQADGYGATFDKSNHGMVPAAQVEVYRGFVFASLNHSGMTLDEHLGRAKELLDRCCDLSPEGELDLTAGWLKHKFKANWKMLPENDCDGYHVDFTHSSFMSATDSQAIDLMQGGGEPVVRDWGNGHIEIDFGVAYRKRGNPFEWFGRVPPSKLPNYVKAMEARYGAEKANEMFCGGPPHAIIFPNLFLGELNVVFYYPVSASECVQLYTPMLLKGAPEVNQRAIHQTEGAVGPGSFLIPEDVIIAERNQAGLAAQQPEWMDLSRGLHREYQDDGLTVSHMSDETVNRAFYRRYKTAMQRDLRAVT